MTLNTTLKLILRCCPARTRHLPTGAADRTLTPLRRTLCIPQERIEAVYFIESGWVSMVAHLDEGTQAEVGLVGFEGMIGLPLVVGVDTAFTDTYMQASGTGLQMEATAFQRELEDNPALHKLLLRYSEAMHARRVRPSKRAERMNGLP
jgi:CRP-like cAMP-binding protein